MEEKKTLIDAENEIKRIDEQRTINDKVMKIVDEYVGEFNTQATGFCPLQDVCNLKYKNKIILTQVDYDILDVMVKRLIQDCNAFNNSSTLVELKKRGYFQGIIFESMSVEEILEKCEVIEND